MLSLELVHLRLSSVTPKRKQSNKIVNNRKDSRSHYIILVWYCAFRDNTKLQKLLEIKLKLCYLVWYTRILFVFILLK